MRFSYVNPELIMAEKNSKLSSKEILSLNANSKSILTDDEIYELFLLLQTLDEMKRSFIMTLCHIFPKEVTSSELSSLSGYSSKSKYIFKSNILESLQQEKIIEITERRRKKYVKLDSRNDLLTKFANICHKKGNIIQEQLLGRLLEENC